MPFGCWLPIITTRSFLIFVLCFSVTFESTTSSLSVPEKQVFSFREIVSLGFHCITTFLYHYYISEYIFYISFQGMNITLKPITTPLLLLLDYDSFFYLYFFFNIIQIHSNAEAKVILSAHFSNPVTWILWLLPFAHPQDEISSLLNLLQTFSLPSYSVFYLMKFSFLVSCARGVIFGQQLVQNSSQQFCHFFCNIPCACNKPWSR